MTQAALPAIRASGPGASVIFVSSIAAGAHSAGWGTYAMTKNGLNAFMHCLADELEPLGAILADLHHFPAATGAKSVLAITQKRAYSLI